MKKTMPIFLSLFLLLISTLDAMSYRDRGMYGSLSLSYAEDIYAGSGSINSQAKVLQEYKLGYKGNIYSPKLLEYNLETIFRYEDVTNQISGNNTQSKIDSQDYKVSASFIKSTKMPFNLYYKTVDRPTSFIYGNTVSKYTQKLESKGISGSIDFGIFRFNYRSTYDDDIFETNTSVDYRVRKYSELSASKNENNYKITLKYNHLDQSTTSEVVNVSSRVIAEMYDRANLSYLWNISESLKLNANMSYYDSKYLLSESFALNANLAWSPKDNYSASISANSTSTKQYINDINEFGDNFQTQDTTTSLGMNQNFSFSITENLNFTESLSYLEYGSVNNSGENSSINFGLNYRMNISDTSKANISGNISGRDTSLYAINASDGNKTTSDEQSIAYSLQAGLSKQIESGDSRFRVTLRHSGSQSLLNVNKNSMLNLNLTSSLWQIIHNNLAFTYSIDNSSYTNSNTLGENRNNEVSRISVSDSINYNTRLGIKGETLTAISATYSLIDNNGIKITRIVPKISLGINYRFWQRLMFKSSMGAYKDLSYDFLNYYTNTGINYKIGKTAFSMSYAYNMTGFESGTEMINIEKSKFDVKIIRRF